jgi:hypothetical protein
LCTGWGTPNGLALIDELAPIPDALEILPGAGFSSAGLIGGPFTVTSVAFSLTNIGASALQWSTGTSCSWLTVSLTAGNLTPGGAATPVIVSLNANANSLVAGTNVGLVWFTNLNTGFAISRQFVLVTSTKLIQNGGFETGDFSGWTMAGNTAGVSVIANSSYIHSGKYGVELGPARSLGYLSQTVATIPGHSYAISFWLENPLSGTPNSFAAAWNGTTVFSSTNMPQLAWTNVQCVATATSTTTVLQFAYRNDPNYLGLDDVSVTPLDAPSLKSLSKLNSTVQFSLSTTPGLTYQIQYTTNLFNNSWINLGQSFTATNSATAVVDSAAVDTQRFYRALAHP